MLRLLLAAVAMTALTGTLSYRAPGDRTRETPALRIVRTYDAFPDVTRFDAECGAAIGPHELLKPDTPADAAARIAGSIDEAKVPDSIAAAFARASSALPGGRLTVCIYAAELSRGLPYMGGVGGLSLGGGRIKLFLHPTKERFARVPYTIAHEYHHEVHRMAMAVIDAADVVVQEGKADHFAVGLYPHLRPPHTTPLSDEEFALVWPAFLSYEHDRPADFSDRFMIARAGTLPRWAGYRLAFEMVGHYLGASPRKPADWLTIPTKVIVDAFKKSPRVAPFARPSR